LPFSLNSDLSTGRYWSGLLIGGPEVTCSGYTDRFSRSARIDDFGKKVCVNVSGLFVEMGHRVSDHS